MTLFNQKSVMCKQRRTLRQHKTANKYIMKDEYIFIQL